MSEWQPIETAPKYGDVIVTNGTAVGEARYYADEDGWWWAGSSPTDFCDHKVWNPSHWMPLPSPPAERA